jgi:hypothetical protein
MIEFSRKINWKYKKLREAPNSASSSLDVKIGNYYFIKNIDSEKEEIFSYTSQKNDRIIADLHQGDTPMCCLIPFLTKIQYNINFPIDFAQLVKCLEHSRVQADPESDIFKSFFNTFKFNNNPGDDPKERQELKRAHIKLYNLLFTEQCIPIVQALPNMEKCNDSEYGYPLSADGIINSDGCENDCLRPKGGIKIISLMIQNNTLRTAKEMHNRREKFGPRPIVFDGRNIVKLLLACRDNSEDMSKAWERLRDKSDEDLKSIIKERGGDPDAAFSSGPAHAATVVDSSGPDENGNFTLTIRNSWSDCAKEFTILWRDDRDFTFTSDNNPEGVVSQAQKDYYYNLILEIVQCELEDKYTDQTDPVKCKEQMCKDLGYDKINMDIEGCPCECDEIINNIGVKIQKVYNSDTGRCECPPGQGACRNNNPTTYSVTSTCDCVCAGTDFFDPACSGVYQSLLSPQALSSYNIVPVNEIKII